MTAFRFRLLLAFAAVYLIWGSTYLAIRFALETWPPFLMAGVRFILAGALLYSWARLRSAPRPTFMQWKEAAWIGALLLFCGNGGLVWAQQHVPSGLASLLIATEPMWMVLIQVFTEKRARVPAATWVGMVLGFAGVALLVHPNGSLKGGVDKAGAALILFSSLTWAAGSLYSRGAALPESSLEATGMEMLVGGGLLLAAGFLFGESRELAVTALSLKSNLALAYLILFGSIIALSAYLWLLKVTSPALASTYAFVNPVLAVLLGKLFAAEPFGFRIGIATVVILGAVFLITLEKVQEPAPRRRLRKPLGT